MSTRRGVLYGVGGLAAFLAVIGAAHDAAPKVQVQTLPAKVTIQPAPAPKTVTRTITVKTPTPMPIACTDYLRQVDTAMQSVIAYDSSVSSLKSAEEAASVALADHDQAGLSEARSKLNEIENNSIGPLQDLFAAQPGLKQAQVACHKALGG